MKNLRILPLAIVLFFVVLLVLLFAACDITGGGGQEQEDREFVDRQQSQYALVQPIPFFDWSLPRHLMIQLYELTVQDIANTYTVFQTDYGQTVFECPSMGYAIPADTSLTNPQQLTSAWFSHGTVGSRAYGTVGLAEPSGVFASQNTYGTWVFCQHPSESLVPVYTETNITTFPAPVIYDETLQRYVWADPNVAPNVTVDSERPDFVPTEP